MSWLAILFVIQLGYAPNAQDWNHGNPELPWVIEREEIVTTLGARALMINELLFVEGYVTTYAETQDASWTLAPYHDTYQFGAGLTWRGMTIGWLHECAHPVVSNWQLDGDYLGREWAWDRFYVQYEGKVEVF